MFFSFIIDFFFIVTFKFWFILEIAIKHLSDIMKYFISKLKVGGLNQLQVRTESRRPEINMFHSNSNDGSQIAYFEPEKQILVDVTHVHSFYSPFQSGHFPPSIAWLFLGFFSTTSFVTAHMTF